MYQNVPKLKRYFSDKNIIYHFDKKYCSLYLTHFWVFSFVCSRKKRSYAKNYLWLKYLLSFILKALILQES